MNIGGSVPAENVCSHCRLVARTHVPMKLAARSGHASGEKKATVMRSRSPRRDVFVADQPDHLDGRVDGDDLIAAVVPEGVGAEQHGGGHTADVSHRSAAPSRLAVREADTDHASGTLSHGGVRVPGGLRRLQSGWDGRSPSGGFDSRPPPTAIESRTSCPVTWGDVGPGFDVQSLRTVSRSSGRAAKCLLRRGRAVARLGAALGLQLSRNSQGRLRAGYGSNSRGRDDERSRSHPSSGTELGYQSRYVPYRLGSGSAIWDQSTPLSLEE